MISRSLLRGRLSTAVPSSPSTLSHTIRPALPLSRRPLHRRDAHSLPPIGTHENQILSQGIDGLYSPEAVEQAWTKYQSMLLNRLSDITADKHYQHMDPKQILLDTARNPETANTFNYASMAHNNHFYWSQLSPVRRDIPYDLEEIIQRCFSSVHTFRQAFLETAASMFGPGFVWLVAQHNAPPERHNRDPSSAELGELRILPTYLAGSPYPGAHARQQGRDMNSQNYESMRKSNAARGSRGSMGAGQLPRSATSYGGADVTPLMCVSTWEHSYVLDWGADGRRLFLQAWWDHINWDLVAGRLKDRRTESSPFFSA